MPRKRKSAGCKTVTYKTKHGKKRSVCMCRAIGYRISKPSKCGRRRTKRG